VLLNDLRYIFWFNSTVPDFIRQNSDGWPHIALPLTIAVNDGHSGHCMGQKSFQHLSGTVGEAVCILADEYLSISVHKRKVCIVAFPTFYLETPIGTLRKLLRNKISIGTKYPGNDRLPLTRNLHRMLRPYQSFLSPDVQLKVISHPPAPFPKTGEGKQASRTWHFFFIYQSLCRDLIGW